MVGWSYSKEHSMTRRHEGTTDYEQQLAGFLPLNGLPAELAEKSYKTWLRGAERVRDAAMELFNTRIDKGIAAATDLARCTTPVDALEVQTRYASDAFNDYVLGGKRIIEVIGTIARDELDVAAEVAPAAVSAATSLPHVSARATPHPHVVTRAKRRATKRGNGHARAAR
jgi:phasin protein